MRKRGYNFNSTRIMSELRSISSDGVFSRSQFADLKLFNNDSSVSNWLAKLQEKGFIKNESKGVFRIIETQNSGRDILQLTRSEKQIFHSLVEIDFGKKGDEAVYPAGMIYDMVEKKGFKSEAARSLIEKLRSLGIFRCNGAKGSQGMILVANDKLLLEYLTDENLVKEVAVDDFVIRKAIDSFMDETRKTKTSREVLLAEIEEEKKEIKSLEDELTEKKNKLESLKASLGNLPREELLQTEAQIATLLQGLSKEEALALIKKISGN